MAEQAARAPRVTVVTRTRNRPLMLTRAVQSVGAQTFQDLELVIVNDAGESEAVDQALASAPEWLRERTQVVTNETSHGREAALEDGLAVSSCEFFAIHDDDDSWEPGFLAACVAHLDENPGHGGDAGTGPYAGALPARTAARPGAEGTDSGSRPPTARAASAGEEPRTRLGEKLLTVASTYASATPLDTVTGLKPCQTPQAVR